jgi:hypothetical protein
MVRGSTREARATTTAHRQCSASLAGWRGDAAGSGTGGHEGGEDVVRVAVEVLAGSVVAHRGARVGAAGGDLDIPDLTFITGPRSF